MFFRDIPARVVWRSGCWFCIRADRSFVEYHFFACLGLSHVVLAQRDSALDLLNFFTFANGSCSVASDYVTTNTRLDQKWITSRVLRRKVKVPADGHRRKNRRITLHLEQIVDVIIG